MSTRTMAMGALAAALVCGGVAAADVGSGPAATRTISFPSDAGMVNVRDFGAKGQAAIAIKTVDTPTRTITGTWAADLSGLTAINNQPSVFLRWKTAAVPAIDPDTGQPPAATYHWGWIGIDNLQIIAGKGIAAPGIKGKDKP